MGKSPSKMEVSWDFPKIFDDFDGDLVDQIMIDFG